jgi:hypothetical protein
LLHLLQQEQRTVLMGMTHERDGLRRQLIEQLNSRDIPACFVFKLLLFLHAIACGKITKICGGLRAKS